MKQILCILLVLAGAGVALSAQTKPKPAAKAKAAAGPELLAAIGRGKSVYAQTCLTCHQADGGGVANLNPPLIKTTYVLGDKNQLARIVLNGLKVPVEIDGDTYSNAMPAQNHLNDQQIADVLTYVRNSFGNKASQVRVAEVKAVRAGK